MSIGELVSGAVAAAVASPVEEVSELTSVESSAVAAAAFGVSEAYSLPTAG